jgi:hypothetical protein
MKIWGNDLKVGQKIYYIDDFEIKYGEVKEIDNRTFKMPSIITDLMDRLFVNQYYYTDKEEAIDNLVETVRNNINKNLEDIEFEKKVLDSKKIILNTKLQKLTEDYVKI